ncbi:hypothetical protein FRC00_006434 [Tulasnella sp. 408]|nr:hypothetical protein FRC00_006434 [Tulasnella sp. 408]
MASVPQSSETSDGSRKNRATIIRSATPVLGSFRDLMAVPNFLAPTNVPLILNALGYAAGGLLSQEMLMNLKWPIDMLPDAQPSPQQVALLEMVKAGIKELSELCEKQLANEIAFPSPSAFAKRSTWALWQQKPNAILCFRPSGKQGLPLCTLDDVFRTFQQQATAELPETLDATQARNAAYSLCHKMPDPFRTERLRSDMFTECLAPVFPVQGWLGEFKIHPRTETHGGDVDRIYILDGIIYILREDKLEADTGDPYMQVVRDYQLYAEETRIGNVDFFVQGAPVFLLSLLGPILLISGGFHDGASAIVEPLAEPCLLFDDLLHNRQEVLARQLFALKKAVDTLSYKGGVKPPSAGVPRVYKTYVPYETKGKEDPELEWLFRVPTNVPHSLLFIATEDSKDPAYQRLVKLVHTYGEEVHQLLEKHGYAPMLYGQQSLEGGPTAYVMEWLRSPTKEESGWVTLFEFFNKSEEQVAGYSNAIKATLSEILNVMEQANMVHGDLRPNNIMLEVHKAGKQYIPVGSDENRRANLKVVDFDWSGKSGSVRYPCQRNPEIAWPAGPGALIKKGQDRILVGTWWSQQFHEEFQDSDAVMEE